jgi:hypothetical protein
VQNHSGVAPVTKQSGKMFFVHRRYACCKFWRQTFIEWAGQTVMKSRWAKAYYHQQKQKGRNRPANPLWIWWRKSPGCVYAAAGISLVACADLCAAAQFAGSNSRRAAGSVLLPGSRLRTSRR